MIDIPKELLEENFKEYFVAGAIFFCKNYDFWTEKPRDKYLLVLNKGDSRGYTYYYLTTSKIDKYINNKIFKKSLFIIHNNVECFTKKTAIIIRDIHKTKVERFKRKFLNPTDNDCLTFCQMIPPNILTEIYNKIRASYEISLDIKRIILPSSYLSDD